MAEFESLRELRLVPAPEAVRTLLEMERAARVAHDAAAAAKRKAKAVAGSHHHKPAHPKQDRVEGAYLNRENEGEAPRRETANSGAGGGQQADEGRRLGWWVCPHAQPGTPPVGCGAGKASGEKEPDATYYTKYLHETLERKAPYPILKGMMHKVIEQFPLAETWLDGGAGTCGVMDALMLLGRKVSWTSLSNPSVRRRRSAAVGLVPGARCHYHLSAPHPAPTLQAVGVELSDVKETTCAPLWRRGLVKQGPLHAIPFPSRAFDLVFSTEVSRPLPSALSYSGEKAANRTLTLGFGTRRQKMVLER